MYVNYVALTQKTPTLHRCTTAAISSSSAHVADGKRYGKVRLAIAICLALRSTRRHVQFLSRTCQVVVGHPTAVRASLGADARSGIAAYSFPWRISDIAACVLEHFSHASAALSFQ